MRKFDLFQNYNNPQDDKLYPGQFVPKNVFLLIMRLLPSADLAHSCRVSKEWNKAIRGANDLKNILDQCRSLLDASKKYVETWEGDSDDELEAIPDYTPENAAIILKDLYKDENLPLQEKMALLNFLLSLFNKNRLLVNEDLEACPQKGRKGILDLLNAYNHEAQYFFSETRDRYKLRPLNKMKAITDTTNYFLAKLYKENIHELSRSISPFLEASTHIYDETQTDEEVICASTAKCMTPAILVSGLTASLLVLLMEKSNHSSSQAGTICAALSAVGIAAYTIKKVCNFYTKQRPAIRDIENQALGQEEQADEETPLMNP